ncbi:MAG: methyltransferase domain-containing protein [Terriglobales bacterium]
MKLAPGAELLDEDRGTPDEIRRSIEDLWWINRHWGGQASWRRLLRHWRGGNTRQGGPILLDVGTGDGRMTAWLAEALGARAAIGLDRRTTHLGVSGARVSADALRLPFADASVEVVSCNLFLHHFHGVAARALLREMGRVARRVVLVSDLRRAWPPYLLMLAVDWRFGRLTRHDGRRSVRQAYRADELRELLQQAGASEAEAFELPGYRLGVVWRRDGAGL